MSEAPPTPTLLPPGVPPEIDLSGVSAWDYTDYAIQAWNVSDMVTEPFQLILLIGVIVFIIMMLYRYAKVISVVRND